jgi:hypothetical protein
MIFAGIWNHSLKNTASHAAKLTFPVLCEAQSSDRVEAVYVAWLVYEGSGTLYKWCIENENILS